MPCRDYDDNVRYIDDSTQRDKLARIACRAMAALEQLGRLDLVNDKESSGWYRQHKIDDAKEAARVKEAEEKKARLERLKKSAMSKLTPAELKALRGRD